MTLPSKCNDYGPYKINFKYNSFEILFILKIQVLYGYLLNYFDSRYKLCVPIQSEQIVVQQITIFSTPASP